MSVNLRFRQVHLDFHTSEYCTNVGGDFDPDKFAETLKQAHVNSINIFAKCHHGYSYYPTEVGTPHPHLKRDLLGEQIDALHRRNILCPVYYSILWDELAGKQHPEWLIVNKDGRIASRAPLSGEWGWSTLDVSTGYREYVLAAVNELIDRYPIDGFWFDICFPLPNYCPWGKAQMQDAGIDVEDDTAVWAFARKKQTDFFKVVTEAVHSRCPNATIFYNGTMDRDMRRVADYMTHFEVESLPTTGQWGYLHYPIMGRQARNYGKDFLGMNGRFHMSWGDFGGIKTKAQLDYECGTIVAAGGKICVGDQLNPNGQLDPAVYRLIGHTFQRIEALEPWLEGAKPVTEIAVLSTGQAEARNPGISAHSADTEGAAQIFLELGYQFDIVDELSDFSEYSAVVIPDGTLLDEALKARLKAYIAGGGRIILSGTAALDPQTNQFQLDAVPVYYVGPAPTVPSYVRPDSTPDADQAELSDDYDYVFYGQSHVVRPKEGTVTFGKLHRALFNRTWNHFMGHQHAPVGASLESPVAVKTNQVLYLAAPFFSGYRRYDYWAYRAIIQNLLSDFLPSPLLRPTAPGWVEFSLSNQTMQNASTPRQIVHIVSYQPRRTSQPIVHVDQAAMTANLSFALKRDHAPEKVYIAPHGEAVEFYYTEGYVYVILPPIGTHSVIVLE